MPRRTLTQLLVAAAWTLWVLSVGWFLLRQQREFTPSSYVDLRVYRGGVDAWLHATGAYEGPVVPEGLLFTYPPAAVAAFVPLVHTSFERAAALLVAVDVLMVYVVCIALVRALGLRITGYGWALDALVLVAPALWLEPIRNTVDYGQINVILLALVVVDLLLLPDKWRGGLTGIAAGIKVIPAVFVLYAVVTGQWRVLGRLLVGFLGMALLGAGLMPLDSARFWSDRILDSGRVGDLWYTSNQSLRGAFVRILGNDNIALVTWVILALVVVVAGSVAVHRAYVAGAQVTAVATTGLVGLLVTPIAWSHHWVWVLPLVLALWVEIRTWAARIAAGLVLAACWIAPQWYLPRDHNAELSWSATQNAVGSAYVWFGVVIVGVVSATRWGVRDRAALPIL